MAISVAQKYNFVIGDRHEAAADVTLDNSYPTGGYALTPANFGLTNRLDRVTGQPTSGLLFEYDYTNKKLKAFFPTGGSGTPAAALAVPKVASGASTASAVDATQPNLNPGVGKEVASGQDLSTVVVRVTVQGV